MGLPPICFAPGREDKEIPRNTRLHQQIDVHRYARMRRREHGKAGLMGGRQNQYFSGMKRLSFSEA